VLLSRFQIEQSVVDWEQFQAPPVGSTRPGRYVNSPLMHHGRVGNKFTPRLPDGSPHARAALFEENTQLTSLPVVGVHVQ